MVRGRESSRPRAAPVDFVGVAEHDMPPTSAREEEVQHTERNEIETREE